MKPRKPIISLSLVSACNRLENHIKKDSKHKDILLELQKDIRAILDPYSAYRVKIAKITLETSQEELFSLGKNAIAPEIRDRVQQLIIKIKKILEALISKDDIHYKNLLVLILKCAESIDTKLKNKAFENEAVLTVSDSFLRYLMKFCGGKYIPTSPANDPFMDEYNKGACFGHVLAYRDQIKSIGKHASPPALDEKTYHYQKQQSEMIFPPPVKAISSTSPEQLTAAMNVILHAIHPAHIYMLSVHNSEAKSSHAVAIRQCQPSRLIEFYDPNFGIFVLPNKTSCSIFLEIFFNYFYGTNNISFEMRIIDQQLITAMPTIPLPDDFAFNLGATSRPIIEILLLIRMFNRNVAKNDFDPHPMLEDMACSMRQISDEKIIAYCEERIKNCQIIYKQHKLKNKIQKIIENNEWKLSLPDVTARDVLQHIVTLANENYRPISYAARFLSGATLSGKYLFYAIVKSLEVNNLELLTRVNAELEKHFDIPANPNPSLLHCRKEGK